MGTTNGSDRGVFRCADGGALQYEVAGSGEPVIFLHGFGLDSAMWDAQWPVFCNTHRVIRYDLRGYGASSLPGGRYSHVEDYIALSRHLGAEHAHVVGLSLGGRLALRIAAAAPERVALVDAALDGHSWSPEWMTRWKEMVAAARIDVAQAKRMWHEHDLFKSARALPDVSKALQAMVMRYSGWHFAHEDPGAAPAKPVGDELHTIAMHCLIVVGAIDLPDFQAIAARLASGLPSTTFLHLPGVGHMANMEDPRQFNAALTAHLADCAG